MECLAEAGKDHQSRTPSRRGHCSGREPLCSMTIFNNHRAIRLIALLEGLPLALPTHANLCFDGVASDSREPAESPSSAVPCSLLIIPSFYGLSASAPTSSRRS